MIDTNFMIFKKMFNCGNEYNKNLVIQEIVISHKGPLFVHLVNYTENWASGQQ